MRVLVAVACIVVVAVGGYWLWLQYDGAQRAARAAEVERQRAQCLSDLDRYFASNMTDAALKGLTLICIEDGTLSPAEVEARGREHRGG